MFIIKVIFFLFVFASGVSVIEYCFQNVANSVSLKYSIIKNNDKIINYAALGSSHGFYGFNPERITCGGAVNLANSSQSLDLDKKIADKLTTEHKELKYIIHFISYFSFEYLMSFSPEGWRLGLYARYFGIGESFFDFLNPGMLFSPNIFGSEESRKVIYSGFNKNFLDGVSPLGWAQDSTSQLIASVQNAALGKERANYHHQIMREWLRDRLFEVLTLEVKNLNKVGGRVLFVSPPYSNLYSSHFRNDKILHSEQSLKKLSANFPNVEIFNYDSNIFTIDDFKDTDHLNSHGATKLSDLINDYLCRMQ